METQNKLLTIKQASICIGVQYRQLLEAVNNGTVPFYQLHKSRKLVSVPEILEVMKIEHEEKNND